MLVCSFEIEIFLLNNNTLKNIHFPVIRSKMLCNSMLFVTCILCILCQDGVVVTGCADGLVRVYDLKSGQYLW